MRLFITWAVTRFQQNETTHVLTIILNAYYIQTSFYSLITERKTLNVSNQEPQSTMARVQAWRALQIVIFLKVDSKEDIVEMHSWINPCASYIRRCEVKCWTGNSMQLKRQEEKSFNLQALKVCEKKEWMGNYVFFNNGA